MATGRGRVVIQPNVGFPSDSFWLPLPPTYSEFIVQIRLGLELSEDNESNISVSVQGAKVKPAFYDVIQTGDVCEVTLQPNAALSSSAASVSAPSTPLPPVVSSPILGVQEESPEEDHDVDLDANNEEDGNEQHNINIALQETPPQSPPRSPNADEFADDDTEDETAMHPSPSKLAKLEETPGGGEAVELIPLPDQKPLEIKPAPAIKSQTKKPKSKKRKQKKEKQAKSTPVHPDQKILTSTPGQQVPLRTPSGTKPVSHQAVVAALVSTRRYNTRRMPVVSASEDQKPEPPPEPVVPSTTTATVDHVSVVAPISAPEVSAATTLVHTTPSPFAPLPTDAKTLKVRCLFTNGSSSAFTILSTSKVSKLVKGISDLKKLDQRRVLLLLRGTKLDPTKEIGSYPQIDSEMVNVIYPCNQ